jgi:voltage-gated potassium channel
VWFELNVKEVKRKYTFLYEIIMMLLGLTVVILLTYEFTNNLSSSQLKALTAANSIIWIAFIMDFFGRLSISNNKKRFIKLNIIDLVSIIPFFSIFRSIKWLMFIKKLKMLKFTKLFTLIVLLKRMKRNINYFVKANNIFQVIWLTVVTIFLGAIGMYFSEGRAFVDSLWWSFVTATTVGYGDISPSTLTGRLIASILMVTGIGLISMLTGSITTLFLNKKTRSTYKGEVIENIKQKLDDFDNLSSEDIDDICKTLKALENVSNSSRR